MLTFRIIRFLYEFIYKNETMSEEAVRFERMMVVCAKFDAFQKKKYSFSSSYKIRRGKKSARVQHIRERGVTSMSNFSSQTGDHVFLAISVLRDGCPSIIIST